MINCLLFLCFAGFTIMTSTFSSASYIRDVEIKIQEIWEVKQIKTKEKKNKLKGKKHIETP